MVKGWNHKNIATKHSWILEQLDITVHIVSKIYL